MPDASNVSTGKPKTTGAIFRAPKGTTLPTDAASQLDPAFVELGFVSDAGVTNANSGENETVYAWGGTPVDEIETEKSDTWTYKLIEALNPEVLRTVYGAANVTVEGQKISIKAGATDKTPASYVVDMVMKGALKRVVLPNAVLRNLAEIVYKDDESVGYQVTFGAQDDGTGFTHYEYIQLFVVDVINSFITLK